MVLPACNGYEEACEFVQKAPVSQLVRHDLRQNGPRSSPMDLYRRWEEQPWGALKFDFTQDALDWHDLLGSAREYFLTLVAAFFLGERAVAHTLSTIRDKAPCEDERHFLATQLSDEVRHVVFFHAFLSRVVGIQGTPEVMAHHVLAHATPAYHDVFEVILVESINRLAQAPCIEAWVEAVTIYHLFTEGYLAYKGEGRIRRFLSQVGKLAAFAQGFDAVCRDESRHVGFGRIALHRRLTENCELARIIVLTLLKLAKAVSSRSGPPTMARRHPSQAIPKFAQYLGSIGLSDKAVGMIVGQL